MPRVRDNLVYAKPGATDEELRGRRTLAAIDERISELPRGLRHDRRRARLQAVGRREAAVALARVLLKDPRILILDEATITARHGHRAADPGAIERVMRGRTTLAIAHRLSTILRADLILVYERGRIVERGTHRELLAARRRRTRASTTSSSRAPRVPARRQNGRTRRCSRRRKSSAALAVSIVPPKTTGRACGRWMIKPLRVGLPPAGGPAAAGPRRLNSETAGVTYPALIASLPMSTRSSAVARHPSRSG